MLRARLRDRTTLVEAPDFNRCLLVFPKISRENQRLAFRATELEISQNENNSATLQHQRTMKSTPWLAVVPVRPSVMVTFRS